MREPISQEQIDSMAAALRRQGLTWSQTNFAISLVRNAVEAEQQAGEAVAEVSDFVGETIINARCLPHTGPMLTVGTKLFTRPQQPLTDRQLRTTLTGSPTGYITDTVRGIAVDVQNALLGITKDTK